VTTSIAYVFQRLVRHFKRTNHIESRALEHAELKTVVSGNMSLALNSEKLAAGQTVKLNEGAIVKLDPELIDSGCWRLEV
jgi:hypothetical protein